MSKGQVVILSATLDSEELYDLIVATLAAAEDQASDGKLFVSSPLKQRVDKLQDIEIKQVV
jgi:hypothetical protein